MVSRTPELSLKDTFLRAVAGLPEEDVRADVVAEALGYLQQGFDAHYAGGTTTDDEVLVGDNAYALAVETIARLDEPRFVAVASRMIRDGAGRIAAGGVVSLQTWTPTSQASSTSSPRRDRRGPRRGSKRPLRGCGGGLGNPPQETRNRLPSGSQRALLVREMFDRIAGRYDLLNTLMTAGLNRLWNR